MDNSDILLLTVPLVILFLAFGVATIKQFTNMGNNDYTGDKELGGAASLLNFLGNIFSTKK